MTKLEAFDKAKLDSKNGYVQHVCYRQGCWYISDWYSDDVVMSYENGKELGSERVNPIIRYQEN